MNSKKLIFLYIFLLLAVVAVMVQLRKANLKKQPPVRDYPQIVSSGELNVATGYNSVGYYVSGDSVVGFQYELIQALGDAWGLKVNIFLGNSLDENLKGLLSGKYDIVAQNIPVNTHLRDSFAFTEPITFNKWVLVQRKAAFNDGIEPIRRHLDLAKKILYVPKNSPAIVRLNNLSHEIGDTVYVEQDDTYEAEQLVMMVAAGEIDFTVCDEKLAVRMAERLPEIDIDTDIGFTQLESWAVRKDSPILLDSLNAWLNRFRKTEKFRQIFNTYYAD
ncbi:MAG: transporter substrate-binding domain-containing protein [Dysgonamonadaceae bacterium]